MKRILIDGRFIGVGDSISRYTLELTKGILDLDHNNSYTLLVRPEGEKIAQNFVKETRNKKQNTKKLQISNHPCLPAGRKSHNYGNLKIKTLDIPHYSITEQTKLLRYINKEKFDLVHFTQFNHPILYRGKFVITIHDLTLIGHLHRQSKIKSLAFGKVMKSAVKNSTMIIASSKTTEKDLFEYYRFDHNKIQVVYLGIDHDRFKAETRNSKPEIRKFKAKYQIQKDYFLYTGMWKKHKNLIRLLKAYEIFRIQNTDYRIQLVLVGKIDREEKEVTDEINRINFKIAKLPNCSIAKEQKNNKRQSNNSTIEQSNNSAIITTGFVEEEELPTAYAGALAYVMPSLSEGFGWPPLEAMACGTPVISSNVSCMPEILGDAPLYFDPYETNDIARKMKKIASLDTEQREKIIKEGLRQVKKYNWPSCVKKTLAVYRQVLN